MTLSRAHQPGSVSKASNRKMVLVFTCLSVFPAKPIITAIIPVREISTANTPSLSCKQIMLRGLNDVCVRNKIIWNQFSWSRCALSRSSASRYSCVCNALYSFAFTHFASLIKTEDLMLYWTFVIKAWRIPLTKQVIDKANTAICCLKIILFHLMPLRDWFNWHEMRISHTVGGLCFDPPHVKALLFCGNFWRFSINLSVVLPG